MNIPPGFGQITHVFGGNGLAFPAVITYGIDPAGSVDVDEAASAAHGILGETLMDQICDDVTLERTVCKYGPNSTGPSVDFVDPIVGGVTSNGAPSNCAYLIRKNTASGGRTGRGRFYLPGVDEDTVGSDGAVGGATVTAFQAECDGMLGALALVNIPMVLLHAVSSDPFPVTSLTFQANIGTQRRRMRR